MGYHTNLRRAFLSWERAVEMANAYGMQTGVKYRIDRVRPGVWMLRRTEQPVTRHCLGRRSRVGRLPGRDR